MTPQERSVRGKARVELGQIWRRKGGKAKERVERVWFFTAGGWNCWTARLHPLNGGRPLVIPTDDLVAEFDLLDPAPKDTP